MDMSSGKLPKVGNVRRKVIEKNYAAAMYYGDDGDGECIFVPGLSRVTEEQYSEMVDRMKQGLIPNVNDLGAVYDAQQTLKKHGREVYDNE
ncbi:hypothetical protein EB001_08680 [bacterium]|nr:hypothetical protein [bacterium]